MKTINHTKETEQLIEALEIVKRKLTMKIRAANFIYNTPTMYQVRYEIKNINIVLTIDREREEL